MNRPTDTSDVLLPGAATLGMIGGGQLGRFFVIEARRLGYEVWVLDPDADAPAMQLASHKLVAAYDNDAALDELAAACDAVSIEFENIPAASLERVAANTRLAPPAAAVAIAQSRQAEKRTAEAAGLQPVAWALLDSAESVAAAVATTGLPAILKTDRLGYDGKGQRVCETEEAVREAFLEWQVPCVLEQRIALDAEVSVVLARAHDGTVTVFPIADNVHRNGILHTSCVPSLQAEAVQAAAAEAASSLAHHLDYVGVLAVEFFLGAAGVLYFNEMAPRPHNSGHYTLDATECSQFEQQLRMLCHLPAGSTRLLSPVCMLNVLGNAWLDSDGKPRQGAPNWASVLEAEGSHLHSYGKREARPGRKMAHVNCLATSVGDALAQAQRLHQQLPKG